MKMNMKSRSEWRELAWAANLMALLLVSVLR